MHFSLGSTNRKRINLGGQTSKVEDRNEFLKRTEAERLRRLLDKKRLQSAIKIQVSNFGYTGSWAKT